MKTKCLILSAALLLALTEGIAQDTSGVSGKHVNNNSDTLNTIVDPNATTSKQNRQSETPHAVINPNKGTSIPSTTSGTLNSSVNPNTQFVIPFHKSKKKSKPATAPDSGIITPKQ
jgi:hypothetical protein